MRSALRRVRRAPARLQRLAIGMLALAVAVTTIVGGRAYVWCAPMAEARAHCCCPHRPSAHDAIRVDCCDDRVTPSLPSSERASSSAPVIAPSPLALVLALDLFFAREIPRDAWRERALGAARAGPRSRVHARASVYLI